MPLITNPEDLIRSYLANSGAATEGGDPYQRAMASFSKMMAPAKPMIQLPGLGQPQGGGPTKPIPPPELTKMPDAPAIKPAPEEDMFKFSTDVKSPQDEAIRKAKEALDKAGGAPTTPAAPGEPTALPYTPEPHPFEGQHTQNTNAPKSQAEFYAMIRPHADKIAAETGLDVNLVMAKIGLETGYGKHAPGFNYFGIKETDPKKGQVLATQEEVDGKLVPRNERFRSYANIEESVTDYIKFLKENGRYGDLLKAKGLEAQLEALQKSGYATDSQYTNKLRKIIAGIPQTKLPAAAKPDVTTPEPPSEPGTRVGEHRSGWFWNGTNWDKAYARGGHIKDLLALSRSYR